MSQLSLSEELLRMAVEIEKIGRALYTSLAKRTQDKEIVDKLVYLAGQEKQHEKYLQ